VIGWRRDFQFIEKGLEHVVVVVLSGPVWMIRQDTLGKVREAR
jgi:hypothetical protein